MKASSLIGHVVELLESLEPSPLPADAVIGRFLRDRKYLGSRDRRFIAETFYGVLRHRRLCDHLLGEAEGVLSGVTGEGRSLLRVAAYLLALESTEAPRIADFLELVDDGPAADRFRAALKLLRDHDPAAIAALPPGIRWSYPDWMIARFESEFGRDQLPRVLDVLNSPAPLSIRVNTLKTSVEACAGRMASEGIRTRPGSIARTCLTLEKRMNAFALDSFREGWFEVQDEGSQFLIQAADPKPTDRVLDMCAGAGGKTLGMSAVMKNRGEIVATDISAYRLKELRKRMRRAGCGNIRVQDTLPEGSASGQFDLVFIDAPCTGVGTIRRNPGMKWTVTEEMVAELAAKQSAILESGASRVRPGGTLLYATCSLFREENEDVVERFLASHPAFTPESRKSGLASTDEGRYGHEASFRLSPHIHDTDGFFCVFLRRSPDG